MFVVIFFISTLKTGVAGCPGPARSLNLIPPMGLVWLFYVSTQKVLICKVMFFATVPAAARARNVCFLSVNAHIVLCIFTRNTLWNAEKYACTRVLDVQCRVFLTTSLRCSFLMFFRPAGKAAYGQGCFIHRGGGIGFGTPIGP